MKLYILFGHRKERYEGEFAPEALEIMDEYNCDDNPSWLSEKLKEYEQSGDFDLLKIMTVHINTQTFERLFFETEELQGDLE